MTLTFPAVVIKKGKDNTKCPATDIYQTSISTQRYKPTCPEVSTFLPLTTYNGIKILSMVCSTANLHALFSYKESSWIYNMLCCNSLSYYHSLQKLNNYGNKGYKQIANFD